MVATPTFDAIVESTSRAGPRLPVDEQQHALSLLRALAGGHPVAADALAARTGQSPDAASAFIDRLPGVYRDNRDRVIGFWGLTVAHMPPHRYRLGDRDLFTWCAWDPFILTPLLGRRAEVASVDAHTGEAVGCHIADGHVTDLSHPGLALSFTLPDRGWTEDVIASFCHFIHLFASEDSARDWTATRPGTFVLPLGEAARLGEAWRHRVLPDVISGCE